MTTTDLAPISSLHPLRRPARTRHPLLRQLRPRVATAPAPSPPTAPTYWRDPEPRRPCRPSRRHSLPAAVLASLFAASGRIGRLEYVLTIVGIWLAIILVWAVTAFFDAPFVLLLVLLAAWLVGIIVSVIAGIKRLHDFDQSGWLILLNLIPFVGFIMMLLCSSKALPRVSTSTAIADSGSMKGKERTSASPPRNSGIGMRVRNALVRRSRQLSRRLERIS